MLLKVPPKGTVLFEYIPMNLNSYRKAYGQMTWMDVEYCTFRLQAGLLYATEEEVLERIELEKKLMAQRKNELSKIKQGFDKDVTYTANIHPTTSRVSRR